MAINIYQSIYRKKQYNDVSFALPLLFLYKQYDMSNIKDVETKHEMMFYLRIIKGNKINFENLWKLIEYYTKKYDSIEILSKCNVDINICDDDNGYTALIEASRLGHIEIVRKLTDVRCKLDIQNKYGKTALMLASHKGYLEIVSNLIDAGCGLDIQNNINSGETALLWASCYGHLEIVRKLISAGCGLDIQDKYGNTALIFASRDRHLGIVRELINAGCRLDIQNNEDKTALDQAIEKRHQQIIDLLMAAKNKNLRLAAKN